MGKLKTATEQTPLPTLGDTSDLTEQQTKFANAYVDNGGDALAAIHAAHYRTPKIRLPAIIEQLLDHPGIQLQIRKRQQQLLQGKLATTALDVIGEVMTNTEVAPRVRLEAAKIVLDKSGIAENREIDPTSVNNLPLDQLKRLLTETKQSLGELREVTADPRLDPTVIDATID